MLPSHRLLRPAARLTLRSLAGLCLLSAAAFIACSAEPHGSFGDANAAPAPVAKVEPVQGEWPQYRGPNRDGKSTARGFLKDWPAAGPPVQWRAPVGEGYSGISVAGGLVYTMYNRGGSEWLTAFDSADGSVRWELKTDSAYRDQFGDGPRSTPLVDGSVVYALGAKGKLVAADAAKGEPVLWSRDLVRDLGARIPQWGIATAPLVEGDLLLVDVGGPAGKSLAAFDKKTGKVVWTSGDDAAGYSAPIAFTVDGVRQVAFFTSTRISGVSPKDGTILWSRPWRTSYDVNAAAPIFIPPNRLFVSSGYDTGSALLEIRKGEAGFEVDEVWKARNLKNKFSSSIQVGDTIYGFDNETFKAIDLATGKDRWRHRGLGHGSLIFADGHFIVLGEKGTLALVEASPESYKEKASVGFFDGKCWTAPTLVGNRLFLRDEQQLVSLDLST